MQKQNENSAKNIMDGQLGSCGERHACLKVFGEETHTERLLTGVELHKLVHLTGKGILWTGRGRG